jgi:hypothetical protein
MEDQGRAFLRKAWPETCPICGEPNHRVYRVGTGRYIPIRSNDLLAMSRGQFTEEDSVYVFACSRLHAEMVAMAWVGAQG